MYGITFVYKWLLQGIRTVPGVGGVNGFYRLANLLKGDGGVGPIRR
jgi:hypothetical protein